MVSIDSHDHLNLKQSIIEQLRCSCFWRD